MASETKSKYRALRHVIIDGEPVEPGAFVDLDDLDASEILAAGQIEPVSAESRPTSPKRQPRTASTTTSAPAPPADGTENPGAAPGTGK